MLKIGITGGIGSGKSIVCKIFAVLKVPVFQSDNVARKLMNNDALIKDRLSSYFGADIYSDGDLNREKLSSYIFSDREKLKYVNSVVHPAVSESFNRWVETHAGDPYIIKEAAIIFESGTEKELDYVIAVAAPEALCINRVMARDGLEREEVLRRMQNQLNDEIRIERSDYIIRNNETILVLPQVLGLHQKILELAKGT